ncbi:MAG: DNA helicase RecG [Candidatus Cloacimonetes bacterium HGW-Cloacimonetes-3]|jgi:ATP-dependent DNA helicase RecG|nr:MAG: DNA helicase RecG [Candidatus Cloacimonetes bacterium HGW-Cloacimonetes-3]
MAENKRDHTNALEQSIKFLKGVGENRARLLQKMGISTMLDLMEYFPRAYINRKLNPSLFDVQVGDILAFTAMISWVDVRSSAKGKSILNVGVSDGKVALVCSWFSYPHAYEVLFKPGRLLWLSGAVSEFNGQYQMLHPEFELIEEEDGSDGDFWKEREVLPVYPLTAGFTQKLMRRMVYNAFALYAKHLEENLPEAIIDKYGFPERKIALQKMHFSQKPEEAAQLKRRFAYEELFYTQMMWARHKVLHGAKANGITFENKKELTTKLYKQLPFTLTGAQKAVLRELFDDMCSAKQMSRLLQGDVGSGKTVVTLFAMLLAVENGYQAALMAPTEILADQHYNTITSMLKGLEISVCILKGGNYKGKSQTKDDITGGKAQIVIGTHALLQKDISFARLGFVCVDEQHRFGVEQRARLARMALCPDLLYLSATPIPRSLAMTVYGDLEVSIINELPPSRKPVQTLVRSSAKIELVYAQVQKELEAGRQVYIVCPLVEESEKLSLLDATKLFEHISRKAFPQFSSALLHGRMKATEKDEIMNKFKAGETKILVSTTVIEVGVDVPNASVMIVEHAERFGLAQMHQLRGRVGRGSAQSYCYLIEHQPVGKIARERLATMTKTMDGFVIAEKDLELRGPGELFGLEQSGMPMFRFANLMRDQDILNLARQDAFAIVNDDPHLMKPENALLKKLYQHQYTRQEELILY